MRSVALSLLGLMVTGPVMALGTGGFTTTAVVQPDVTFYMRGSSRATLDGAFVIKKGIKADDIGVEPHWSHEVIERNFTMIVKGQGPWVLDLNVAYESKLYSDWFQIEFFDVLRNEKVCETNICVGEETRGRVHYAVNMVPAGSNTATVTLGLSPVSQIGSPRIEWSHEVVLDVEAEPDARYSTVELGPKCQMLNWTDQCSAVITLHDSSGFLLPDGGGGFAKALRAFISSARNPNPVSMTITSGGKEEKHDDDTTSDFSPTVVIFGEHFGRQELLVYVWNVPIAIKDNGVVEVGCGSTGIFSKSHNDCVCAQGYQVEQRFGVKQCVECALCKPGFLLDPQGTECKCKQCPPGQYCPNQNTLLSCPKGSQCPGENFKPNECQADHFSGTENSQTCKSCQVDYDSESSTFGRVGGTSARMCSRCPLNAFCDSSRLYSGLEHLEANRLLQALKNKQGENQPSANLNSENKNVAEQRCLQREIPGFSQGKFPAAVNSGSQNTSLTYVATPLPGYFRFPPLSESGGSGVDDLCASVAFIKCPGGEEACLGGEDTLDSANCGPGYAGFLCMACDVGYAHGDGGCLICNKTTAYFYVILAIVVIIVVTLAMVWQSVRKSTTEDKRKHSKLLCTANVLPNGQGQDQQSGQMQSSETYENINPDVIDMTSNGVPANVQLRSTAFVTVMKIAWSHLQVISLILSLKVDWHESMQAINKFASILSFSSSSMTSSAVCLFDEDSSDGYPFKGFYAKILLVFAFPFAAAVIIAMLWMILALFRYRKKQLPHLIDYYYGFEFTQMVLLFLAHILIVRTALELIVCISDVQGRTFLLADPRIECLEGAHTMWFFLGGLGGLLFYGAGIPALNTYLVMHRSNRFLTAFMIRTFKKRFGYWESVVVGRKVTLTIFVVTLEKYGANVQGLICIPALFVALYIQLTREPYMFRFLNQLEATGIVVCIATLTLALYSLSFDEQVDFSLNIAIALLNLAFMAFITYELLMLGCIFATKGAINAGSRRESLDEDDHRPGSFDNGKSGYDFMVSLHDTNNIEESNTRDNPRLGKGIIMNGNCVFPKEGHNVVSRSIAGKPNPPLVSTSNGTACAKARGESFSGMITNDDCAVPKEGNNLTPQSKAEELSPSLDSTSKGTVFVMIEGGLSQSSGADAEAFDSSNDASVSENVSSSSRPLSQTSNSGRNTTSSNNNDNLLKPQDVDLQIT